MSGTSYIIGVDLSGPTNVKDTVFLGFKRTGEGLALVRDIEGARDEEIYQVTAELASRGTVVVGLDAPLSYNPGGGDRPGDAALRERITAAGLHPGSVMTPTMTRMAYLTLRGITVTRLLSSLSEPHPRMVEVHPGAALALRGANVPDVRSFKVDPGALQRLLGWLFRQGINLSGVQKEAGDHHVAACAAALAAWKWDKGESAWRHPADPPHHPFDLAC